MKGQIKEAKFVSIICLIILFIFGIIEAIIFSIFPEKISNFLIKDPDSRYFLNRNIKILAIFITFVNLLGGTFGVIKSLNKQKDFMYLQIFCNYVIHYGSMCIFLFVFKMDSVALWYSKACSIISLVVCGFIMISKTNWEKKSRQIVKD